MFFGNQLIKVYIPSYLHVEAPLFNIFADSAFFFNNIIKEYYFRLTSNIMLIPTNLNLSLFLSKKSQCFLSLSPVLRQEYTL